MAAHAMAGWMERRGPTADFNWQRRWVVLQDGKLETFLDQDCQVRKAMARLKPESCLTPFKAAHLGDSALYRNSRPNGFVLDLEPEAGSRQLVYFDPLQAENLEQWVQAIEGSVKRLNEAMWRDLKTAAQRLVHQVVLRCCKSPQRVNHRRVARHLLRGIFSKISKDFAEKEKEVSALGSDKKLAAGAVRRNSSLLRHMPQEMRSDREIVLAAVEADPMALAFADESLKADRDVVFSAVSKDGMALEHSSEELKADRDLVLAATLRSPGAIKFAPKQLKEDDTMKVF